MCVKFGSQGVQVERELYLSYIVYSGSPQQIDTGTEVNYSTTALVPCGEYLRRHQLEGTANTWSL